MLGEEIKGQDGQSLLRTLVSWCQGDPSETTRTLCNPSFDFILKHKRTLRTLCSFSLGSGGPDIGTLTVLTSLVKDVPLGSHLPVAPVVPLCHIQLLSCILKGLGRNASSHSVTQHGLSRKATTVCRSPG